MNSRHRVIAAGPWGKLFWFLLGVLLLIGVLTYLEPWTAQYEVKMAAKIACNTAAKGRVPMAGSQWEKDFVNAARRAGVKLTPRQYLFEVKRDPQNQLWRCRAQVAWKSVTSPAIIGDVLQEVPPLTLTHRLDFEHEVRDHY